MTAKLGYADRVALADAPWLQPFVEDGDIGLDSARARYERAMRAAQAEVRAAGTALFERMRTSSGHETTALQVHPKEAL
jgi:hypothetical protein